MINIALRLITNDLILSSAYFKRLENLVSIQSNTPKSVVACTASFSRFVPAMLTLKGWRCVVQIEEAFSGVGHEVMRCLICRLETGVSLILLCEINFSSL